MKRICILMLTCAVVFFSYCTSSKKATAITSEYTYEKHIQPVIASSCGPCHLPSKGGKKPPLESFTDVSYNIDQVIRRIELHPGEKGFMPLKKERLSDSTINMFKEWKKGGLAK